ncbi:c-type cytochrome [Mesobacillus selenatarsenatis]|uniref:Cytochrome c551 n=1 Tax=Mesobacillus selenatarsenatis (strain DSM 18680 / JCM 14380 / FERM P-15431 / SF-1) TaxID=1321606 RepID=A0A0A8WYS0_MESS1|nr:c-type cytochrome [Mesobacillus selenatarsenatis]GAM12803.1 cytochrome c551 [Mesobacillus selenatarsenatis SF-1]
MSVNRQFFKMGFATVAASLLLLAGCSQAESNAAEKTKKATTEEHGEEHESSDLELRLAGGKLGSESLAFVGGGSSNKLWVIDAKYHKLVTTIDAGGPKLERTEQKYPNLHDTHAVTFTKDFKLMFTVDWFNYDEPSYAIAFDPATFEELWRVPVGKGGHHSALSPDDKYLYVANQYGDTVSVIDVQAKKKIKELPTGKGTDYISPSMYWDGKAIDSPYLFVSVDQEDKVTVIDWKKNEVVKDIPVGASLHGVNLTPDGKYVWAAVGGEVKKAIIIDVATLEIKDSIEFEQALIHISFSPDGKFAYVTTGGNKIFKVDTTTYEKIWNSTGTTIPAHTGVSPDGKELWTLNHGMDKRYSYQLGGEVVSGVQVWDTENGELITEIPAEGVPHEIQFVPYSAFGGDVALKSEEVHSKGTHSVAEAGEKLYKQSCITCHGSNLEGGNGPALNAIGGQKTKTEIFETIKNGKGMMPSGLVSETEAKILANWLAEKKLSESK